MANKLTLKDIGELNANIEQYIITNDCNVITNSDGSGNIIIYHHEGIFTDSDVNKSEYVDLYVGDEHIAGGYGFKDLNEKDSFILDIKNIKDDINEINKNIEDINLSNQEKLKVDSRLNSFTINNTQYKLEISQTNVLKLNRIDKLSILECKLSGTLTHNNITTPIEFNFNGDDLLVPMDSTIIIDTIEFVCSTSNNLKYWSLFSNVKNNQSVLFTDIENVGEEEYSFLIYKNYYTSYLDEKGQSNAFEGKYKIYLDDNQKIKIIQDPSNLTFEFKFVLVNSINENIVVYFPKIKFLPAFYWMSSNEEINKEIFNEKLNSTKDFGLSDSKIENFKITINHEEESFGYLIIPIDYYLSDDEAYIEFTFVGNINIKIPWSSYTETITNDKINYLIYKTPQQYVGEVEWILNTK